MCNQIGELDLYAIFSELRTYPKPGKQIQKVSSVQGTGGATGYLRALDS